jgi:hypothetical protein
VEPAILHATLALGSAHRKESFDDGRPKEPCAALDTHQEFMLREYSEAIRALQPHFSKSQDRKSAHVALATCALFTFFENLLGRYAAGRAHLHSGLRLLAEHYAPVAHPDTQLVSTKPRGYVDDWIIEIFSRLHIQAALLGQGLPGICPRLPKFPAEPTPTYFKSTNQAGNYMDRLMFDILHLAEQASTPTDATGDSSPPVDVRDGQQRLRKDLMSWLSAYNATPTDDREAFSSMDLFYIRIPRAYHTMFTIILNTISWPACEMMYDYYTEDFMSLIKQLVDIWKAHTARPAWHLNLGMPDFPPKMAHSVGDKGWLPLVHFVAVKCRVHRIRRQAIRLLGQTMHKEGIWDSTLTLAVAKEVVRIEEGDYYQALEVDDDFDVVSIPTERDIALPPLPEYRRISNVQVGLPEHSLGALTLEYDQRRKDGGGMKRKKRQYDLRVRQWSDSASAMAS